MGIFIKLNNVDRFPGLVLRVKGKGDEIEIGYDDGSRSEFIWADKDKHDPPLAEPNNSPSLKASDA